MADGEDIQPLVCDNGTGMVKVCAASFSSVFVHTNLWSGTHSTDCKVVRLFSVGWLRRG
jgi:hypothetical protein